MRRSQLRFLRVVCPESHVLAEVVPGLDGPVVLLKGTVDKARPAIRLSELLNLGRGAVGRCQCECGSYDVPVQWLADRLAAGVARVVWPN